MPEMDGLTLLEELKQAHPLVKAVIVSAYGDMENIRTAMNRGAFDFPDQTHQFSGFRDHHQQNPGICQSD
jgi:DNA-binding NtrC family response regulator